MTQGESGSPEAGGAPPNALRPGGITATTFWVAFIFLATRALGFVREPLVAAFYGATASADSFYVALGIVNLVQAVVLGGLVPSVIPLFVAKRRRDGDRRAWSFLGGFSFWLAVGLLVLGGVMLVSAEGVVSLFAPGLGGEVHTLTAQIFRILLVLPALAALATTLSNTLNCYDRFVLPASGPLVGSVFSLVLLLALTPSLGITGAAVAVVAGVAAQLGVLGWGALRFAYQFRPGLALRDPDLKTALRLALPGVGSEALLSVWPFVIVLFATSLPAGTYSSIQFGGKLQVAFLDVLLAAVSVVMFPRLVLAAQRDSERLREMSAFTVRLMITVLLPVTVAVVALRYPLVQLVYERRAFDSVATAQTATALGLFALSLVPLGVKDAVVRTFYALQDVITPLRAIVPAVVVDLALSAGLVGRFGAVGLLAAFAASSVVLAVALLWLLRRRGVNIINAAAGRAILTVVAATTGMALVLWLTARTLPGLRMEGSVDVLARVRDLAVSVGLSGAVYMAALVALRHSEATDMMRSALSRVRTWLGSAR